MQQLSAQDAQFLYLQTSNNLTHVTGIALYDQSTAHGGKVRFKDIIKHVESRLDTSPVFKRRLKRLPLDFDFPYWIEDNFFDLEHHITHVRLPDPGDWRQFCIHISRYHSRPMDMNRPLWDMYVVEGLDGLPDVPKGSYAIVTRVHHAAIDGASAAHFFAAISDLDAKGTRAIPAPKTPYELGKDPSSYETIRRATFSNMMSPVKMAQTMLRFTPALWEGLQKSLKSEDGSAKVPFTRFNQNVSPHKVFDAVGFQLDDMKKIRALAEGSTLNDVVLAVCSGALRLYLAHHGELPDDSLIAVAPINARSKKSGNADKPGNNISAMNVALATHLKNPVSRLQTIRDTTQQTKAAKSGLSARMMTDLSKHIPGATMAGVARVLVNGQFAPQLCNLFISNVPGPQVPLYMNGAKTITQYGMAPLSDGMGLFIATPSYNGEITFGITSCRNIMPDVHFFRECLKASYEELFTIAVKTAQKSASTKKPAKKTPVKKTPVKKVSAKKTARTPAKPTAKRKTTS